jgi:hypothetical protein
MKWMCFILVFTSLNNCFESFSQVMVKDTSIIVWNGETAAIGSGWVTSSSLANIKAQNVYAHSGKTAIEFSFNGSAPGGGWIGAGWDWVNWKTGAYGTDITSFKYLTFWAKVKGTTADWQINLLCNGTALDMPEHHTDKVSVFQYCPQLTDGEWHEIKIPLADLKQPPFNPSTKIWFDPLHVAELHMFNAGAGNGSFFIDDLGFCGPDTIARYKIDASSTSGGSIVPNGNMTIGGGANLSFYAIPNTGFQLADLFVDGVSNGVMSYYTLSKVAADHTIEFSFVSKTTSINSIQTQGKLDSFTIKPNTVIDNIFYINYNLAECAPAEFRLYDLSGKLIEIQKPDCIFPSGEFNWILKNKPQPGIYLINMYQSGVKVASEKMIFN